MGLERNSLIKIQEYYNIFFSNVSETIQSLIQLSTNHLSDISNVIKDEVFEVRIKVNDIETKNNINDSNNYLKLKPLIELREPVEAATHHDLHPEQSISKVNFISNERNIASESSSFPIKESMKNIQKINQNNDSVQVTDTNNEPCNKRVKIYVYSNEATKVYECDRCTYKCQNGWLANKHVTNEHNTKPTFIISNNYRCTKCSFTTKDPCLLIKHENIQRKLGNTSYCQKTNPVWKVFTRSNATKPPILLM